MRPVGSSRAACSVCVSLIIKNNLFEPTLNFQGSVFLNYHLLFSGFMGKKFMHTHAHAKGICLSLVELLINPFLIHLPNCALLFFSFFILQLLHWVGGLEGKHIHYVASIQDRNRPAGDKIKFTDFPCTCHKLLI